MNGVSKKRLAVSIGHALEDMAQDAFTYRFENAPEYKELTDSMKRLQKKLLEEYREELVNTSIDDCAECKW